MAHRHLFALVAVPLLAASPASAQLFGEPAPARTIMLAPGWHLNGAPVRSSSGLHLAVRNDEGSTREVTVSPSGAVSFSPAPAAPRLTEPKAKPRKQKPLKTALRPAQPKTAPARSEPRQPAVEASVTPAASTTMSDVAPVKPAAAPAPAAAPVAPQPAPTGPGFAHGVPINPLD